MMWSPAAARRDPYGYRGGVLGRVGDVEYKAEPPLSAIG
jgi:hypothetical protein